MASPVYDVCVIGSGAAGGVVTKTLCEAGAKVILMEAGQEVKPTQYRSHCWPYELPYRGMRSEKQELFYPPDLRDSIRYTGGESVSTDRIRVLGGRTLHWNAVVLRFAAQDFRERSHTGIEVDWPLSYDELAPYYERIEQMIGVCGQDDKLEILPAGQHYLPPIPWRCSEHILKKACSSLNMPVIPVRKAMLTKPYDRRPACHYCGHCMDGCDVAAIFSSTGSMLPKAKATGNLTLRMNAVARELLTDDEGRIRAVSFVDRLTRQEEQIQAKVFVLCAATVETARLLLNSKSPRHPNGLANSSDAVGRYLHGHCGGSTHAYLKDFYGKAPFNQDGATDHVYIPRSRTSGPGTAFGYQVNYAGYQFPFHAPNVKGYGAKFKKTVREMQPGYLMFGAFGKVVAKPDNRITIDPQKKDQLGIPIPVVSFRFSEEDLVTHRTMKQTALDIASRLNATVYSAVPERPTGFASHEVGTVRMGSDAKTSVLNAYGQAHEVKNLWVTDGSSFPTSPEKNPTLTIMALSLRASERIVELRKKGEL